MKYTACIPRNCRQDFVSFLWSRFARKNNMEISEPCVMPNNLAYFQSPICQHYCVDVFTCFGCSDLNSMSITKFSKPFFTPLKLVLQSLYSIYKAFPLFDWISNTD